MDKINSIIKEFTFSNFIKNPYQTLVKINDIIEENPKYYQALYELSESRFFMEKLKNILNAKILQDSEFLKQFSEPASAQGAASFFVGGLANIYSDWFNKKIDYSLDEIVELLSKFITKYFNTL